MPNLELNNNKQINLKTVNQNSSLDENYTSYTL